MKPELEDVVVELAAEPALVSVLPLPVDNLEGDAVVPDQMSKEEHREESRKFRALRETLNPVIRSPSAKRRIEDQPIDAFTEKLRKKSKGNSISFLGTNDPKHDLKRIFDLDQLEDSSHQGRLRARQYVTNLPENPSTIVDSTNIQMDSSKKLERIKAGKHSRIQNGESSKPFKKRKKESDDEELKDPANEYQPPFQQFYQHLYPGNIMTPQEMYNRSFKSFQDADSNSSSQQNY